MLHGNCVKMIVGLYLCFLATVTLGKKPPSDGELTPKSCPISIPSSSCAGKVTNRCNYKPCGADELCCTVGCLQDCIKPCDHGFCLPPPNCPGPEGCQFGPGLDKRGCFDCDKCFDACEFKECSDGEECFIDLQIQCIKSPCFAQAQCRKTSGEELAPDPVSCPVPIPGTGCTGTVTERCNDDRPCSTTALCCEVGCLQDCIKPCQHGFCEPPLKNCSVPEECMFGPGLDDRGCFDCDKCFNACDFKECSDDEECFIDLQIQCIKSPCFGQAQCRRNKPGTCPVLPEIGPCKDECIENGVPTDRFCPGEQKCCFNGFCHSCQDPVFDESIQPEPVKKCPKGSPLTRGRKEDSEVSCRRKKCPKGYWCNNAEPERFCVCCPEH